jgi:PAS domain S-box-containing protein
MDEGAGGRDKAGRGSRGPSHGDTLWGFPPELGEESFLVLLENDFDAIAFYDERLRHVFVNRAAGDIFGMPPEELIGKTQRELGLPGIVAEAWEVSLRKVFTQGRARTLESALPGPEGPRYLESRLTPVMGKDGSVRFVLAITRDVTELKESEKMIALQRDLAMSLSETGDLRHALELTMRAMLEATGMDAGGIYLVEGTEESLRLAYHCGLTEDFVRKASHYGKETPQAGLVFSGRSTVHDYEVTRLPLDEAVRKEGLRAVAVVPMEHEGNVMGCVNLASHRIGDVTPKKLAVAESMAGQLAGFISRNKAQQDLKRSEELFRTLLGNSSDALAVATPQGDIKYASPSLYRLMGFRPEEVIGRSAFDFIHPEDRERCARELARLENRPGDTIRQVFRFSKREGGWRTLEGLVRNLVGDPLIDGYVINARDITELVSAEERLSTTEARYRAMLESTGTSLVLMDGDTEVHYMNREMLKVLGLGEGVEQGRTFFSSYVDPEDLDLFCSQLKTVERDSQLPMGHIPLNIITAGGKRVPTLATMARLPGSEEVVVSFIDVSMEKLYEEKLEEHAADLRDFLSVASHELRHPITLVKGYATILKEMLDEGMQPEELREHLSPIIESSGRLAHLAEELLEVSRIEQQRIIGPRKKQDLRPLVDRAAEEMVSRTEGAIRVSSTRDGIELTVDGEGIYRMLVILLENAVQFSPAGEAVEVSLDESEGSAVIRVMDRGPGIDEEHRERVFERFYQVEEVRHHSRPGLGLGLYIAKCIAEGHDGRIFCGPREGGGTVFTVELPLL